MSKEAYKFRNKWAKEEHGYLDWNELAEDNWSGNMAFYENGVMQAYSDEVNKHYTKGVEEFALKVVYSKQKDGRHFLEIFAEDGKRKFQEWCKYKDGSFNYR